ncbi:nucleoside hydrolase [Piscibacillus salipiscarius]|uniref:Nucleoside hydrolase n=1 Tax=Piscibacillus salipiscarius TaxID=299480 RepID=A0ABW5QB94_9BACI|nr:nucleoside hydrolase [Piscibacillus salipiscarius]
MAQTPVIIDTDPGIDDFMMLLVALIHEKLDVQLITTAPGNLEQNQTYENALKMVSYLGKEIEVARGLNKPIFKSLETAPDFHGETGTGNVVFPKSNFPGSIRTAISAMYDVISKSDVPITIVTSGPLTNVGLLLSTHPELKSNIKRISMMGGAVMGGNVIPTAEFNIYADPDAAELVFRSGVPVIMSGLDATRQAFLTEPELENIRAINSDLSDKVYRMLKFYQEASMGSPFNVTYFEDVVRLHDVCAAAYIIDPSLFSGNFYYVTVERNSPLTAGTTFVDYLDTLGRQPNAYVLHDVDRERLVDLFIDSIRSYELA